MTRDKTIRCHVCSRYNWHEEIRCVWCGTKLRQPWPLWAEVTLIAGSLAAIAGVVYVMGQL